MKQDVKAPGTTVNKETSLPFIRPGDENAYPNTPQNSENPMSIYEVLYKE